jgi:hypothetical protein
MPRINVSVSTPLLIANVPQIMKRQSRKRNDRCTVERGIVEAVHQMNDAGSGGAHGGPQPAGMLGEAGGDEGGRLLVPHRNEADAVLPLAKRFDDGLMPSPTIPKACVAPQSINVSIKMSEVFIPPFGGGMG